MRRGLALAAMALGLAGAARAAAAGAPIPSAHDFARDAAIWNVSISPDGAHIVALTSPDGVTPIISVWRTDAPGAKPVNLGSAHMRFLRVGFLKNDRLLVTAIQTLTVGVTRGHVTKQYVTDLDGKVWTPLLPEQRALQSETEAFVDRLSDAELISSLPRDPQNVLVEDERLEGRGDIYKVDVYSGRAERIEQGSERFSSYAADLNGELRAKEELNYDNGRVYIALWLKSPDSGKWEEHFRSYARDRSLTRLAAFTTDPNVVYLSTTNGGDKTAVYAYDIRQRKLLEPVFAHKLFDVGTSLLPARVVQSRDKADYGAVLGFGVLDQGYDIYWTDERMDSIAKGVAQALGARTMPVDWTDPGTGLRATIATPDEAAVTLTGWSDDRRFIVVEKSGPKNPGEYYLLTGGTQLALLGKARPWIDPAALGDGRLVEYPARDGLMIPAFLTTPPKAVYGPGPYPTLIEPHGGPWARDEYGWDVTGWTQYFAARGYAVLQPQFRGSEGWGQKLWRAGDGEWGQKMQDDKDDGVKWLVAQKIADPARVVMFGYSYGGYAALAASIRPNGLYQCAISGAGAGDLASLEHATFDNRFQREFQHPTIKGLDALEHAREAQIPVLLYHGDRDQTVDVAQSRKFAAALKAAGKPYKLVEIPDMGHQFVTWTPAMAERQLVEVDAFLKDGCKPGGL
ncbi:MAG: prolyl oligopeptidase family serine peptidase [Caulobacteraceae bacterium]|nr:prolyl oligopeptidase family serine peptidase [Caulobacteraceae bacterium]